MRAGARLSGEGDCQPRSAHRFRCPRITGRSGLCSHRQPGRSGRRAGRTAAGGRPSRRRCRRSPELGRGGPGHAVAVARRTVRPVAHPAAGKRRCLGTVRDRAGPVLLNRTLHPGETWEVPAKPNLLLTTGNAGGTDRGGRCDQPVAGRQRCGTARCAAGSRSDQGRQGDGRPGPFPVAARRQNPHSIGVFPRRSRRRGSS